MDDAELAESSGEQVDDAELAESSGEQVDDTELAESSGGQVDDAELAGNSAYTEHYLSHCSGDYVVNQEMEIGELQKENEQLFQENTKLQDEIEQLRNQEFQLKHLCNVSSKLVRQQILSKRH